MPHTGQDGSNSPSQSGSAASGAKVVMPRGLRDPDIPRYHDMAGKDDGILNGANDSRIGK